MENVYVVVFHHIMYVGSMYFQQRYAVGIREFRDTEVSATTIHFEISTPSCDIFLRTHTHTNLNRHNTHMKWPRQRQNQMEKAILKQPNGIRPDLIHRWLGVLTACVV